VASKVYKNPAKGVFADASQGVSQGFDVAISYNTAWRG